MVDISRDDTPKDPNTDPVPSDGGLWGVENLPARTQLGRYVLLRKLGTGGMGVVYLAHDPRLDRDIAVKVLRGTSTGAEVRRTRLMREAQAMAKLADPNVVDVYDVGVSKFGVYIAMELIDGDTLKTWIAKQRPHAAAILRVCIDAGRGVAAAHAAGILHRDLKPGNILVATRGQSRSPKAMVVDFGLARATGPSMPADPTDDADEPTTLLETTAGDAFETPLTQAGFVVGTPAYMAPEQRAGAIPSVATDQFSFCVTVFEALAGYRLAQRPRFEDLSVPSRPQPTKDDRRLLARVQPVLERGLEEDPALRFPSMQDLLQALHRAAFPVNRRIGYASFAATVLAAGAVGFFALRTKDDPLSTTDCADAQLRLAGVWDAPRRRAVEDRLTGFGKPNAIESWKHIEPQLDAYASTWATAYTDACEATHVLGDQSDAELDARMRCLDTRRAELEATVRTLHQTDSGSVKHTVSQVSALRPIERCNDIEALLADVEPPTDPEKAALVQDLRSRIQEAEVWRRGGKFRQAERLASSAFEHSSDLGYPAVEAEAAAALAEAQYELREVDSALGSFARAYALATEAGHDVVAARVASKLVIVYATEGARYEEAMKWSRHARAAIDRRQDKGSSQSRLLESQLANNIGALLAYRGEHRRAREHYLRALAKKRELYGDKHWQIATTLENIGISERRLGLAEQALQTLQKSVAMFRETLGEHHPNLMNPLTQTAGVVLALGRPDEAEALYAEVWEIAKGSVGVDHPHAVQTLASRGAIALQRGDFERAVELNLQALNRCKKIYDPNTLQLASCHAQLASVYGNSRLATEAHEHFEQAFSIAQRTAGDTHPFTATIENGLGDSLVRLERFAQAQAHLEHALNVRLKVLGEDHLQVAYSYASLSNLYTQLKNHKEALRLAKLGLDGLVAKFGEDHPQVRGQLTRLGHTLLDNDLPAKAMAAFQRSLAPIVGPAQLRPRHVAEAQFGLAQALVRVRNDREQARKLSAESLSFFESAGPGYRERADEVQQWRERI